MKPINKNPLREIGRNFLIRGGIFLVLFMVLFAAQSQIRVPNMIVPNDSWGLIDANNIYGGCMQVDTHAKMLQIDVQFLKRGMLFVVYDDDDVTPGAQTKMYLFAPLLTGPKSWNYNTPFEIPQVQQNNNIISAGLMNYLIPLNITANTDPGNKLNVYYDNSTNQFYKYDQSTDPATYVVITPAAANISVVAQNGISSTNVQSALEELNTKIDANTQRVEIIVQVAGITEYPVGFALKDNSQIFYNGALLDFNTQWKTGATSSDLKLLVQPMVFDKIRIQR
ncbi:MAG: hypothetical protein WCP85_28505 [Mariniphaga sp.]